MKHFTPILLTDTKIKSFVGYVLLLFMVGLQNSVGNNDWNIDSEVTCSFIGYDRFSVPERTLLNLLFQSRLSRPALINYYVNLTTLGEK